MKEPVQFHEGKVFKGGQNPNLEPGFTRPPHPGGSGSGSPSLVCGAGLPVCLQPNPWTCYPTVASHLTGIPYSVLIETLGHDGSKIVKPELPEPSCREAFSYSEMALALLKHGWALIPLYSSMQHENGEPVSGYPAWDELTEQLKNLCDAAIVVVQNDDRDHCLAFDVRNDLVVDPLTGKEVTDQKYPVKEWECLVRVEQEPERLCDHPVHLNPGLTVPCPSCGVGDNAWDQADG